jgi:hypothetical protein
VGGDLLERTTGQVACEDDVDDVLRGEAAHRRDRVDDRNRPLHRDLVLDPDLLGQLAVERVDEALAGVDAPAREQPVVATVLLVPAEQEAPLPAQQRGDADAGLKAVREAVADNSDMGVFLKMILRSLRFLLLLRFSKDMKEMIADETGEEEFEKLSELSKTAKSLNSQTLMNFLDASAKQSYSSIPELPVELAIIDSCQK